LGKGKRRLKSPDEVLLNVDGAISPLLAALFESPVMGVALLDSQFRFRAINGALAMNGVVELTGLKNLEVSLSHMIGKSSAAERGVKNGTAVPGNNWAMLGWNNGLASASYRADRYLYRVCEGHHRALTPEFFC
jgi:hypothetical protein